MDIVVLLPESTRKSKGGDPHAKPADDFAGALPAEVRDQLYALRAEVAAKWKNEAAKAGVMPAYLRYEGNMYRHIPREMWERRKPGVEVLIATGLYGLVASRDTVFAYPHSMAEPMPPFGKLNRWWRDRGLPAILAAYLEAMKPKTVVDLLSLEYREAVEGYAEGLPKSAVKTIDFPGMGRASQPKRGEKVASILWNGKI
jgi:hypothetical protein